MLIMIPLDGFCPALTIWLYSNVVVCQCISNNRSLYYMPDLYFTLKTAMKKEVQLWALVEYGYRLQWRIVTGYGEAWLQATVEDGHRLW